MADEGIRLALSSATGVGDPRFVQRITHRLQACPLLAEHRIAVERVRFFAWNPGDFTVGSAEVLVPNMRATIALWYEFIFTPTHLQDDVVALLTASLVGLSRSQIERNPKDEWSYDAPALPGPIGAMDRADLTSYLETWMTRWGLSPQVDESLPLERLRSDARWAYLVGSEGLLRWRRFSSLTA